MRPVKLVSVPCILAMAIFAFAAANAFSLPEILDHVPSTFAANGSASELIDPKTGLNVKCESISISLANGKILNAKEIEATIDFEQCSVAGIALVSLGDKNDTFGKKLGLVLLPVKGQLCYIGAATKKEAGIFFKIPPLHIEAPALGELIKLVNNALGEESSLVASITPNNKLQTGPYTLTTKGIKQECDGKQAQILMEVADNKKPLVVEKIISATITMDEDEELMVV